jgi:hypothetical protein
MRSFSELPHDCFYNIMQFSDNEKLYHVDKRTRKYWCKINKIALYDIPRSELYDLNINNDLLKSHQGKYESKKTRDFQRIYYDVDREGAKYNFSIHIKQSPCVTILINFERNSIKPPQGSTNLYQRRFGHTNDNFVCMKKFIYIQTYEQGKVKIKPTELALFHNIYVCACLEHIKRIKENEITKFIKISRHIYNKIFHPKIISTPSISSIFYETRERVLHIFRPVICLLLFACLLSQVTQVYFQ